VHENAQKYSFFKDKISKFSNEVQDPTPVGRGIPHTARCLRSLDVAAFGSLVPLLCLLVQQQLAGAGDVADVWVTVCKTVRPMLRVCCPVCSVQSVCLSVTFEHCGQTIGRMKMKLNWHAGRPQPWPHCVRWRPSPSYPQKGGGASSPIFGLFLLWPNRLMHQDATWDPASPSQKGGGGRLPNFRPMSIVAKRLDASSCHLVWR